MLMMASQCWTNYALLSWDTRAKWNKEKGAKRRSYSLLRDNKGQQLQAWVGLPSAICWNEAWVQHLLDDISMIYVLVCATYFFRCRWRVGELDRILRTPIAKGSEKSFCCVSYFQRCVKVKLPLTHPHMDAAPALCCKMPYAVILCPKIS